MNKYIDAEKLIAEIERLKEETPIGICEYDKGEENGRMEVLTSLQSTIDSLQHEHPMPDSTKLIELWHQDKEMLKEKDFRGDQWRLARNAFMCGFGRGIAVNKKEQPEPPSLIAKAIIWFNNIAESAKKLSAGNVSHLAPTIAGMAIRSAEFLEKRKQSQPKPTCKNCGFYENNCPFIRNTFKPYPNRVCKDYTYSVMKEQEQPEVDLEEEINRFWDSCIKHKNERGGNVIWSNKLELEVLARHFYELGLNARKK